MSLAEKIQEDVINALKSGDKKKLSISRYLSSELKNYLIKENLDRELSRISDDNFYKIVKTQVKQKRESLEFAEKVGDSVKVDDLNYDINYLNSFLPKLIGEKDTHQIIVDIINKNKFLSKDFGRIMGILKKNYNNKIDLNSASKLVKDIFNEWVTIISKR